MTPCSGKADSEKWCCGDTNACCESGVGVVKIAQVFGREVEVLSSVASAASRSRSSSSMVAASTPSSLSGIQGKKSEQEGLGGGVIAGSVIGALAGLAVLAAVVLFGLRRRKNRRLGFAEGSMAPPQYGQNYAAPPPGPPPPNGYQQQQYGEKPGFDQTFKIEKPK